MQRSKWSVASAVESVGRDQCRGVRSQRLVLQSRWSEIRAVQRSKWSVASAVESVGRDQYSGVSGQRLVQWSKESKVSAAEPVVGDWQRDWCVGNHKDCTKRISKNVNSGSIFPENKL